MLCSSAEMWVDMNTLLPSTCRSPLALLNSNRCSCVDGTNSSAPTVDLSAMRALIRHSRAPVGPRQVVGRSAPAGGRPVRMRRVRAQSLCLKEIRKAVPVGTRSFSFRELRGRRPSESFASTRSVVFVGLVARVAPSTTSRIIRALKSSFCSLFFAGLRA